MASAIAEVLHAEVCSPEDVSAEKLAGYDLVGFGSGIYFGRFHSSLRQTIEDIRDGSQSHRKAFLFSTSGLPILWRLWHWPLRSRLLKKGFTIVGDFHCRGFDTVGPLWLLGGLNRRHPNERDLHNAAAFAHQLSTCEDP